MVGQHLGWIEFRRDLPLNPAIVECPIVGRTPTRWSFISQSTRSGERTNVRYYCCYQIILQARLVRGNRLVAFNPTTSSNLTKLHGSAGSSLCDVWEL